MLGLELSWLPGTAHIYQPSSPSNERTPVAKPHGSDWTRALRPVLLVRIHNMEEWVGNIPLLGVGANIPSWISAGASQPVRIVSPVGCRGARGETTVMGGESAIVGGVTT